MGNADALSLGSKEKEGRITVEGVLRSADFDELLKLFLAQRALDHATRLTSDRFDKSPLAKGCNAADLYELSGIQTGDNVTRSQAGG